MAILYGCQPYKPIDWSKEMKEMEESKWYGREWDGPKVSKELYAVVVDADGMKRDIAYLRGMLTMAVKMSKMEGRTLDALQEILEFINGMEDRWFCKVPSIEEMKKLAETDE